MEILKWYTVIVLYIEILYIFIEKIIKICKKEKDGILELIIGIIVYTPVLIYLVLNLGVK